MADQPLPLHGTAYYGQARFDVGLFGWLKDWTHCSNAFCMLCYPNTLTRIAWKANIVICGIKTPKLRGFLWAAFFFLFAFECINFLLGSTVITVVAWFGLGLTYVWSVFVLHKTVQENQRLRPVCFEGDNAFIACCCMGCAINQLAHQVDIQSAAWVDFSELEAAEAGYSTVPSQAPSSVSTMERGGPDSIYQPPISIKETASVSEDESAMPPDGIEENNLGFKTTDPL